MKQLQQVIEVENEGLISLLEKEVMILCFNYFYTGTLAGVNDTCIKLTNAHKVYDTGSYTNKKWTTIEKITNKPVYIQISAIESFFESNKL